MGLAIFGSFEIKVIFDFKSQGTKKDQFFSQRTNGSTNLRYKNLITIDYKYKEILLFAFLDIKLWLKEEDSDIHSNSSIRRQKVSVSFSHCSILSTARLQIYIYLGSTTIRLSYLKF